jgi:bifunctional DNA-binding transcriptional regulator/antitoxin component of YhaV-PrlF toxin-antitoxin module
MASVIVEKKFQITLPRALQHELGLKIGDVLTMKVTKGALVLIPHHTNGKKRTVLTSKERAALKRAAEKIDRINRDMIHSRGLTKLEAAVAAKIGLIDLDQAWWWLENWQKGEREVERNIRDGNYKTFVNVKDALGFLNRLKK